MFDGDISIHGVKGAGRQLDISGNEVRGLLFYRRNGRQVEGLMLNTNVEAVARKPGFVVHGIPGEKFSPAEPYDVVVLSNVLEHSVNPREMLRHVFRILAPTGQAWIRCPNWVSLLRIGRFWIHWHVPFHIVQFSPRTLQGLLKESNFGSVFLRQVTLAIWVAQSLIAVLCARQGSVTRQLCNPALVASLMLGLRTAIFPLFWAVNRAWRGDCLVVTAMRDRCVS